jgi:hypothetical protein
MGLDTTSVAGAFSLSPSAYRNGWSKAGVRSQGTAQVLSEIPNDADVRYTIFPENVMKHAGFMATVGSIKLGPARRQDLFSPHIHGAPGSQRPREHARVGHARVGHARVGHARVGQVGAVRPGAAI